MKGLARFNTLYSRGLASVSSAAYLPSPSGPKLAEPATPRGNGACALAGAIARPVLASLAGAGWTGVGHSLHICAFPAVKGSIYARPFGLASLALEPRGKAARVQP